MRILLTTIVLLASLTTRVQADEQRLRDEITKLRDIAQKQQQQIDQLATQVEKAKQEAIAAKVEERLVRDRSERLLLRVKELEKELTRLKAGGLVVPVVPGGKNFPTERIGGKVTKVGTDGLMVVSVGSDAGLKKGHHLQLFRLDPKPEKSKYLGVVEIVETRENEAVARVVGKLAVAVEVGDRVASQLLNDSGK